MQIFVDADACPVVGIVEKIAEKYNIPTTLLCDTNHILCSDYSEVIVVDAAVELAAKIAVRTVNRFLRDNPDSFDLVEWVLFDTHTKSMYEAEVR